ncbi:MAG: ABC transporter permease [Gemmatimonadota bacterium]|jgi:predicted permease
MRRSASPPWLASALARGRLPEELAEAVVGDLEEEYRLRILPARGRMRADLWFWGQVVGLRAGTLRRISRRLKAMRPTWERNRPRRVGSEEPDFWSRMPMRPEDLRYAVRRLARSPGFTLVAVLSLALGIGANTAMFSIVNAVLIRQLPVKDPGRLVEIYTSEDEGYPYSTSSYPDFDDLRAHNDVFTDVVGARTFLARVERGERPEMAFGEVVSWDYFKALGVRMALGRSFLPEEDATPGAHAVVILGYRTWVKDFGKDPGVLGRTVRLNGVPFTVVGVAPEAFTGSMPVVVTGYYAPLMMTNELMGGLTGSDQLGRRGSRSMFLKARLKPGVTVQQANEALKAFSTGLAERFPDTNEHRAMSALPSGDVALHPYVDRMLKPVAALLLSVVGLVLLIACANLASFLLARAEDRRKEIAVRLALGAGRGALIRQLLVETTVLALLGGVAGLLLADWTLKLLTSFQPPIPVPIQFDISLDRTVLFFTAGVSLVAGVAFGLAPALQATNPDVAPTLKDEAGRTGKPGRFNLRNALVVMQVAFSFVLLIGAGLFVRSLQKAQRIDPGFYTGAGALLWPMPELSDYDTPEKLRDFYREARARLLADPGIEAVAVADRLPLGSGIQTSDYVLPGVPSEAPDGNWEIDNAHVSPSYFATMDVRIDRGRAFEEDDVDGDRVVVVSEAFVNRFYPGEDVVGRTIEDGRGNPLRILGVARDTKVRTLGEAPRPYVYEMEGQPTWVGGQIVVRGRGTGPELLATARRILDEVDPDLVYFEAKTMNEHLALMLFPPRMAAVLLSVFGGLALLLAAIGIYGVVSYAVSRRTREMGIRISLGASVRDVVTMAVGGGMRLVLVGGVIGVALAGGVTWALQGYLYGIGSTDLVTFAAIPVILSGVALVAALVPARRASTVDPVRALRSE